MAPSRRQFLRGALPVAAALAGCASPEGAGHGLSPHPAADPGGIDSSGSVDDPPVRKPRNPDGERVLVDPSRYRSIDRGLVESRERADRLAFADGVPAADAEATRAFLDATDFSAEAVLVVHRRVASCDRYRVESVSWGPDAVDVTYCSGLAPPDVRCRADATETVGLCIRLPEPLDGEVPGVGATVAPSCENRDVDWTVVDANATEGDG